MPKTAASAVEDLLTLMARLREPETGCPWDLQQSYQTIAPSTLEEAYEVVDTIERGDLSHLKEELGDLLFQVVFYAQLGKEEDRFDFADIAQAITEKLLRRHPHVFPAGTLASRVDPRQPPPEAAIKQQWEAIKSQERNAKGHTGQLADVPVTLPAMSRAVKLQKRASQVGFDWPDHRGVRAKVEEEWQELAEAITSGDREAMAEELGDTLFCLANLARHLKLDPETVVRRANRKFEQRFNYMEAALTQQDKHWESQTLDDLEDLWQAAKRQQTAE